MTTFDDTPGRLFLVGCPRSGTTLLQSMLAAHPSITSFPETHFFNHIAPGSLVRRWFGRVAPDARQNVLPFFEEMERPVYPPDNDRAESWIRWWTSELDALAGKRGATAWLEKTPSHLERIESIQRHVPDATFIHLIRNGVDTVASLYAVTHDHPEIWGGARDIDTCIDRWVRSVRLTARWSFEPNHTVAHYGTLVENPALTLSLICQFLGVDFEPSMLREFQSAASNVIEDSEEWKASNRRPLENKKRRKFQERFGAAEQRYILHRLRGTNVPWPAL